MEQNNHIDVNRQPKLKPPKPQAVEPENSTVNVTYKITPTETKNVYIYRDIDDLSTEDKRFLVTILILFFGLGFMLLYLVGVTK